LTLEPILLPYEAIFGSTLLSIQCATGAESYIPNSTLGAKRGMCQSAIGISTELPVVESDHEAIANGAIFVGFSYQSSTDGPISLSSTSTT